MILSWDPVVWVDVIGSILTVVITFACVQKAHQWANKRPDDSFRDYIYLLTIALAVFAISRSVGHLIKQGLLFFEYHAAWKVISPFTGALNSLTFVAIFSFSIYFQRSRRTYLELERYQFHLEDLVTERTKELEEKHNLLQEEIVERKQVEHKLLQSQKMEALGTLAGGIAHDFNNILTGIWGFTQLAKRHGDEGNKEAYTEDLTIIFDSTKRAIELVKQILTFSRQKRIAPQPVQPSILIKEALKLVEPSLPTTVHMNSNIESDSFIFADPSQIHQLVMNLTTNACHAFDDKPGMINVSLTDITMDETFAREELNVEPGRYMKFTISDTGRGIPKETLSRIFDPFFTTKPEGEGTGLGLAVVHGIVQESQGAITVVSSPDKGTTFDVFFPIIDNPKDTTKMVPDDDLPGGREAILFVDDEMMIVKLGEEILKGLGYRVTTMTSSTKAFEILRKSPEQFDLLITDIMMPELNGAEMVAKLREIGVNIPVVAITGYSANVTEENAQDMGIATLLMKPIMIKDLALAVRKTLDKYKP